MGKPVSVEIRSMIQAYKEIDFKPEKTHEILTKNHPNECPAIRTIYYLYKLHDQQGNMKENLKGNVGRKKVLSDKEEKTVVKKFKANPEMTLRTAAKERTQNQKEISYKTVSNILQRNNISAFKKQRRIILTQSQREQRFSFAKAVQRWTQHWKQIIFNDECILKRGKIGNKYVWIENRNEIQDINSYEKCKYPQSLHVFGVISYDGTKELLQVNGNLNQDNYISLLNECFQNVGLQKIREKVFMQDRASCHFGKKTMNWLQTNKIKVIENWPPKGADLNPIECVWGILKDELTKYDKPFKDLDEMFLITKKIFYSNTRINKTIQNTITSLPKRVQEIIKTKGEIYTK